MNTAVAVIRQQCRAAATRSCSQKGCKLILDVNLPRYSVLINMDKGSLNLNADSPRCDYLFVAGEGHSKETPPSCWIVPIELTSGDNKKARQVRGQLQAGADFADSKLPKLSEAKLRPVFAAKGFKKFELNEIKKIKIKFRKELEIPRLLSCGELLSRALK